MSRSDVKVIAHRGFHAKGVRENSLEGIMLSNELADGVEFDVRQTNDGVMVLCHDPVTPFGTDIAASSLAALSTEYHNAGDHLTTFEEALEAIEPGKLIFAEVKVDGIATRILETVPYWRRSILRIGTFWPVQTVSVPAGYRWLNANREADIATDLSRFGALAFQAGAFPLERTYNLPIGAWGIRSVEEAELLVGQGVRYLISDDPESLAHLRRARVPSVA
jgi:glycerophosphoryl diester phosphodiesterase